MRKPINPFLAFFILIILASIAAGFTFLESNYIDSLNSGNFLSKKNQPSGSITTPVVLNIEQLKNFTSEEDLKQYLEKSETSYGYLGSVREMGLGIGTKEIALQAPSAIDSNGAGGGVLPERVSQTNVQVAGIDEPDIVKTDGKEIYYSLAGYYSGPVFFEERYIPRQNNGETKAIKAFPPDDLDLDYDIKETGSLLLQNNILIIFSDKKIYGYDVSNPKSPKKKWTNEIDSNSYFKDARLYNDKIYLITQSMIDISKPCPIMPLKAEGLSLTVKCDQIYHPTVFFPADVTYNTSIIDPISGKIEKNISILGSSYYSMLYMSEKGIYLTYSYSGDFIEFLSMFFKEKCQDLVPSWFIDRLEKLSGYDISDSAKQTELNIIFQKYLNSLNNDESLKMENEFSNRMSDYYKEHKRELEKTGIVKIGLDDFSISASGNVPGKILNQFSLDEYENHLRVAVTVGEGFWGMAGIGNVSESANDVYVLDKDLKITGEIKDLGLEERIYSARFIQDKGYLVTFRQTDPFYVLDLSNPQKPKMSGELKIPGYSSYLHSIAVDRVLGIGKEGSRVKVSLFDVKSAENPKEVSKYNLNEYWSDILDTHHAFLLDSKHQIFFMPGNEGGYIFSYKDDNLKMVKAVSDIRAKRAVYLDNYLYIIGEDKIVVLYEINLEEINELDF
jgi:inhibitor of cysteine peptidase